MQQKWKDLEIIIWSKVSQRKTNIIWYHLHMELKIWKKMNFFCCSVTKLCLTLCNPMNCSKQGFSVHHHLPESAQTHVHWVSNAIQPSQPLLPPSSLALNFSQHQGLFQWVSSSQQVAKVLELQLQHQSFQ